MGTEVGFTFGGWGGGQKISSSGGGGPIYGKLCTGVYVCTPYLAPLHDS